MFNFGSLSKYLLFKVVIYSVVLSLLTSLLNGWITYQDALARQQAQVDAVLAAYRSTLTKAIWEVDFDAAQQQMQGLSRFTAILSAQIISNGVPIRYEKAGADLTQDSPVLTLPLLASDGSRELAKWEIRLDQNALRHDVIRQAIRFGLILSTELLLIALFLFLLLRRIISMPIQALSAHVSSMNEARLGISAPMPDDKHHHEIHDLAKGISKLQTELLTQFSLRDQAAEELAEHRDQLNQLLVQQEHQLDILLKNMADGGAVLTGGGRIMFANPALARLMGNASAQSMIGCWPLQWLSRPSWPSIAERLIAQDSLLGESLFLNRIDAQSLPVEASFSVLERNEQGEPMRVQVMVRDLTARIETERVLVEAKETALQASQAKSAFLANMSHEIRTPLNAVLGFTSLLTDTKLDSHQQQYIHSIHEAGTALLTLLNDILDFSKIEAGQLKLESIEFDLRSLLEDTQDIIASHAQRKGLELICVIDASVPSGLIGDPSRLRQIVLNLLNNAVKFTPQGEIITRARVVAFAEDDVRVRIEVKDNGIGIAPDIQQQLFRPFQQADVSTTRRFGGTGLGLSICRRLATAMDGEIGVQSQVGEGALFWFEVQLGRSKQIPRPMINTALAGKTVLIMSPSAGNRQKLHDDLRMINCQSVMLENEGALMSCLLAHEQHADVILIDLPLAAEIVLDLPSRIHEIDAYQHTPVLLSVTQGAVGQGAMAEKAGYAAYLTKPIHFDALQKCLAEVLRPVDHTEPLPMLTLHRIAEIDASLRNAVLLVEDNLMNQKIGVLLLEKLGCRVDVANNGLEAVEAVKTHHYDLVLMDCQMPELDGYDATEHIRQLAIPMAHVPIVALTANAFAEDRERCLAVGMNDFMSKPVQLSMLETMLQKWVNSAKAD